MKQIHILLVEDNEADIFLTTEILQERQIVNKISVARDGIEAIIFLQEGGKNIDHLPDLILLDINLPKKNGHEVLQFIKRDDQLKQIPVLMFSTSSNVKDISMAYANNANCFITKPSEISDLSKILEGIQDFWFSIAQLPKE